MPDLSADSIDRTAHKDAFKIEYCVVSVHKMAGLSCHSSLGRKDFWQSNPSSGYCYSFTIEISPTSFMSTNTLLHKAIKTCK